ncbi:MAG TPA: helix-turn-helix domain-containing protein [bacterium]|jgi:excisionase family DNA binding protein|nr:helix-turn-helix domain-containing protein [bacterium]
MADSPAVTIYQRPFLTIGELAEALGVSPRTVYGWCAIRPQSASVPRAKLGRSYAFDLDDVISWLKEARDPRGSAPAAAPSRRMLARPRRRMARQSARR